MIFEGFSLKIVLQRTYFRCTAPHRLKGKELFEQFLQNSFCFDRLADPYGSYNIRETPYGSHIAKLNRLMTPPLVNRKNLRSTAKFGLDELKDVVRYVCFLLSQFGDGHEKGKGRIAIIGHVKRFKPRADWYLLFSSSRWTGIHLIRPKCRTGSSKQTMID